MPLPPNARPDQINLDRVLAMLTGPLGIDYAQMNFTPDGVAHIVTGPTRSEPPTVRYSAVAGPGSYGWGRRDTLAEWDGFTVGADDDGATEPLRVVDLGITSDAGVALLIAEQARKPDPTTPLTLDEVRVAFDVNYPADIRDPR